MKALLLSPSVVVYVDDVMIRGRSGWEHDKNFKEVMNVLNKAGMHANAMKVQCAQKKVKFLGYDISEGRFSLDIYAQDQQRKLLMVSSRTKIKRTLGCLISTKDPVLIWLCRYSHCRIY